MAKRKKSPNAMDINEYREIKDKLKELPVNKDTATKVGRGTTTLALIKKSRSFKNYLEMRRKARNGKKDKLAVETVNEKKPRNIKVTGGSERPKKIAVIRGKKIYERDDFVVVPAALFEALSEQMTELSKDIKRHSEQMQESTKTMQYSVHYLEHDSELEDTRKLQNELTFRERVVAKLHEIKKRWGVK